MRCTTTGQVFPKRCGSWLCHQCNLPLRIGAAKYVAEGASTVPDGCSLGMFTFTEPAQASLDLAGLRVRHKETLKRLRRRGFVGETCTAVEFQRRGALHPHIVAHVPGDVAPYLREHDREKRNRRQYAYRQELAAMAMDVGWGPVCDAVLVAGVAEVSRYAVKSLSGYATKEAHRKFKEAGARRVRPLRASRGWAGGKQLRDFQRGEGCLPGPFEDVTEHGPCA